jgi:hypothetical protein
VYVCGKRVSFASTILARIFTVTVNNEGEGLDKIFVYAILVFVTAVSGRLIACRRRV